MTETAEHQPILLSEVMPQMKAGAVAALEKRLDYRRATHAFILTLAAEALEQEGNNQAAAADRLGFSRQYLNDLIAGRTEKIAGVRARKEGLSARQQRAAQSAQKTVQNAWRERYGDASPADVLGRKKL